VTRPVDRLIEAGLVVRENSPSDRRSIHVELTPPDTTCSSRPIAAQSIDHGLKKTPESRAENRP
jgi:DNA-binding MarR family transcriptional regulator